MTATISFDVTVEVHEPSGAFVARCGDFPGKVGIGLTEQEAVADLKAHIPIPFLQPIPPLPRTENPWHAVAGSMRGHPLWDEWRKAVEEYREAKDREEEMQR